MRLAKFDEAHCPPPDKKCPKADTLARLAAPVPSPEFKLIAKSMPFT
jgi:hypothetical protein